VVWPAALVDDGGWIDVLPGPKAFTIEPGYADEVTAVFDRRGHRFRAVESDGSVVLEADSAGPQVDALVAFINAATDRWAPDLEPIQVNSLVAAFDRVEVFNVRSRRRFRRLVAAVWGRMRDRAVSRTEERASSDDLHDVVLGQAASDAEELVAREQDSLPGLDIGVTRGMTDRGVWTWGVHAFLLTGRIVRQHLELLAYRRPGENNWTVVQSSESARARTEEVLRVWRARLDQRSDPPR
jgi:hypothetical protein